MFRRHIRRYGTSTVHASENQEKHGANGCCGSAAEIPGVEPAYSRAGSGPGRSANGHRRRNGSPMENGPTFRRGRGNRQNQNRLSGAGLAGLSPPSRRRQVTRRGGARSDPSGSPDAGQPARARQPTARSYGAGTNSSTKSTQNGRGTTKSSVHSCSGTPLASPR